jgi:hypothetical protein
MNNIDKLKMDNVKLKMKNENNSQLSILNSQLNKVEWKTLGEVAETLRRTYQGKSKPDFENGNAKYVTVQEYFWKY